MKFLGLCPTPQPHSTLIIQPVPFLVLAIFPSSTVYASQNILHRIISYIEFVYIISIILPVPIPVLATFPSSSVSEESWSDDSLELSSSVPKWFSSLSGMPPGVPGVPGISSGGNAPIGERRPTGLSICGVCLSALPLEEEWTEEGRRRTLGFLGTGGGTWRE